MTPSQRINAILDYYKMNVPELSRLMGMDRPQRLYDVHRGKTKRITDSLADSILQVLPELNPSWLLTGYGEMIVGARATQTGVSTQGSVNGSDRAFDSAQVNVTNHFMPDERLESLTRSVERLTEELSNSLRQQARLIDIIDKLSCHSFPQEVDEP